MSVRRYTFSRAQRLKEQLIFVRATRKGDRETRGPLVFNALPSPLTRGRLGIRIGRRCGTAPTRNRVKRMLREAYRQMQHDWPIAVDLVITVKPHAPLPLAEYQRMMSHMMMKLCRRIQDPLPRESEG